MTNDDIDSLAVAQVPRGSCLAMLNSAQSFIGLQPRWLSLDRVYKVFITRNGLYAAYVAGQIHSKNSAVAQLQLLYIPMRGKVHAWLSQRRQRQKAGRVANLDSPEFSELEQRNLVIPSRDIVGISVVRGRRWWALDSAGTVRILLARGVTLQFILIGRQDADRVAERLRVIWPEVAVSGEKAKRWRWDRGTTPRKDGGKLLVLSVLFLLSGLAFATFGVFNARLPELAILMIVAILNIVVGVRCFLRWSKHNKGAKSNESQHDSSFDSCRR